MNGTNNIIPVTDIATNMHVNFNFQDDPNGTPRNEVEFAIEALLEYRLGSLDFAVLRLAGRPGSQFGIGRVAFEDAEVWRWGFASTWGKFARGA